MVPKPSLASLANLLARASPKSGWRASGCSSIARKRKSNSVTVQGASTPPSTGPSLFFATTATSAWATPNDSPAHRHDPAASLRICLPRGLPVHLDRQLRTAHDASFRRNHLRNRKYLRMEFDPQRLSLRPLSLL